MKSHTKIPNLIVLTIVVLGILVSYSLVVRAAVEHDIEFPIPELGNCTSETDCKTYCNEPENFDFCLAFVVENNIISAEEAERARRIGDFNADGPGGCNSQESCEAYCEDTGHIDECLAFAEENDLLSEEELREAREVSRALQSGANLPGGCTNKTSCEAYCNEPSHIDVCLDFAEAAGFIPQEEADEARKVARALASGLQTPGNCQGHEACDAFCNDPANGDVCLEFAVAAGLIDPEEAEMARRFIPLMARGEAPGGCRSDAACNAYCEDDAHQEECFEFAVRAGFVTPEEAEMFRETGGRGPGGCQGEECETFCNDPAHQDECFQFARDHGLISDEELGHIREGSQQIRREFNNIPSEVLECLRSQLGQNVLDKIQSGELLPGPEIGANMQQCFGAFPPPGEEHPSDFQEGGFERGFEDHEPEEELPADGFRSDPPDCSQTGLVCAFNGSELIDFPNRCLAEESGSRVVHIGACEPGAELPADVAPEDQREPEGDFRPPEGFESPEDFNEPFEGVEPFQEFELEGSLFFRVLDFTLTHSLYMNKLLNGYSYLLFFFR